MSKSLEDKEEREGVTVMFSMMIEQNTRQTTVTPKQRQTVKHEIVQQIGQGVATREARMNSAVPMHRTTVYRLLKRVRREGEGALTERRHGHPIKLRGTVLALLCEHCTEAFLSQVARADGAERFTEMLGSWATRLWHPTEAAAEAEHPHCLQALTCYVDGHRKPVYSDVLLPRGLVGRLSVVLGCRALLLLHDEQGHPLFVTTHRGDQHLTTGVPALLERYEQQVQTSHVARMIVAREGMATEFLARLHAEGRIVVTILQTNQYRDLSSFSDVGPFEPLGIDTCGQVIREVAPARITLPREEHPDDPLRLQVALIRNLRRKVETRPDPEKTAYPRRWDGDLSLEEQAWWREGWQATVAPAKATTAKLIPIVTTEAMPTIDTVELAQTYIHRWPAQENVIKDYLRPLGLDTNHGFAKTAVENSEVAKRRTHLSNASRDSSSGHRAQTNAEKRPAADGNDCARPILRGARSCIKNCGSTSSRWKHKTFLSMSSDRR